MSDQSEIRNPKSETDRDPGRPRPRNRKPVIGLAGGIGAGKSTVAAEFAKLGCLVLDSDRQGHEALARPEVAGELARWLGPDVLDEAGRPIRGRIAERVFGRPELVERINALVHPLVHRMRREAIGRSADDSNVVAIVLDTPLLFEAGVDGECDATVFIDAPAGQRAQRVAATRGWSSDQLARRQRHQLDPDAKRARCGYVIRNAGDVADLAGQVRDVLAEVLKRFRTQ